MKDSLILKEAAKKISPNLFSLINWKDIWELPISSGTAFEWCTFLALAQELEERNYSLQVPLSQYSALDYFIMRNEIPHHFIGKVGHFNQEANSKDTFLYSLFAKVVATKDTVSYSIFREGHPYHKLMSDKEYDDRPDIIISKGKSTNNFPLFTSEQVIDYSYEVDSQTVYTGKLQVINSQYLPLLAREPEEISIYPGIVGVIECSVNKTKEHAEKQLNKYCDIFDITTNDTFLITANNLKLNYNYEFIDLTSDDLADEFIRSAQNALNQFKIF